MLYPPEAYGGWLQNSRAPKIGDIGTIVEVLNAPNLPSKYVVEASSLDGIPDWLSGFDEEELEPVPM